PAVGRQVRLEPVIGEVKVLAVQLGAISVSLAFRSQRVVDRRLHVALDVKVEEAVEEAYPPTRRALRDPDVGPAMVRLQMLDDAGRFRNDLAIVDQHWESAEGPQPLELGVGLLIFRDLPIDEFGSVGPDGDQHLPAVAAERVDEEFETCAERRRSAHQLPSLIFSWRACPASLGCLVAN